MINEPIAVVTDGFQQAWTEAVRKLMDSHWELRNLVVQIKNPSSFDFDIHRRVSEFAQDEGLLGPRQVAYTIFPAGLYRVMEGDAERLFRAYNRRNGWFERARNKRPRDWGTYFRRMTHYETGKGTVNQLNRIILAIRSRRDVHTAAYTVVIQKPGPETARTQGGPCLNYIAVQLDRGSPNVLGLLAVYRNHDFLERAYGNYWGLCSLLDFLAQETEANAGPLTCISSKAYVASRKTALNRLVESL